MKPRSRLSVVSCLFATALSLQTAGRSGRKIVWRSSSSATTVITGPAVMHNLVAREFASDGIDLTYTTDVQAVTPEGLAKYDGLLIFRDSGDLPAENEAALLSFIDSGKGLVAGPLRVTLFSK